MGNRRIYNGHSSDKYLLSYFDYITQVNPIFYVFVLEREGGISIFLEKEAGPGGSGLVRAFYSPRDIKKYMKYIQEKMGYSDDIMSVYQTDLEGVSDIMSKLAKRYEEQLHYPTDIRLIVNIVHNKTLLELGSIWESKGN